VLAGSSGCRNERRRARAFPVLHWERAARFRAEHGRTGQHRERARCIARRCAARAVQPLQRCAAKARTVPHLAGKARGAARKRNDRGRNDRRRMEIVAKTRDEPMLRAWARSGAQARSKHYKRKQYGADIPNFRHPDCNDRPLHCAAVWWA
jgi:hypothetical protein